MQPSKSHTVNTKSTHGNTNRQATHSAHSSTSVTRLNRGKTQPIKRNSIGVGNHRKDKNYSIFKDTNVIYIKRNLLENPQQERRKSHQVEKHVTVQHVQKRQSLPVQNQFRTNSINKNLIRSTTNNITQNIHQSEDQNARNPNRKKSFSSSISKNIPTQFKSNRVSDDQHRISIDHIEDLRYKKKRKRGSPFGRYCCILSLSILAILLLAAIIATILSLLLKNATTTSTTSGTSQIGVTSSVTTVTETTTTTVSSTTTTTVSSTTTTSIETMSSTSTSTSSTTATETTTSCTSSGHGNLSSLSGTNPSVWTLYQFNYTATQSSPIIAFGFKTNNNYNYYLDDVSVVDTNASSIELIQNGNFDNSSTIATDWTQWCGYTCSGGSPGTITSSGNCYSGFCYTDNCFTSSSAGIDFLGERFDATMGSTYTISFRLILIGSGTSSNNAFYADII